MLIPLEGSHLNSTLTCPSPASSHYHIKWVTHSGSTPPPPPQSAEDPASFLAHLSHYGLDVNSPRVHVFEYLVINRWRCLRRL